MSSCLSSSITFYTYVANCNTSIPSEINDFSREIEKGKKSSLHYLWIYPINLTASLIGIALAPVAALLNLVAAAFFGCFAAFSDRCQVMSKLFLILAVGQLTDSPIGLFLSIFYPAVDMPDPITYNLGSCLGINNNKRCR